jgi:hypothetical protein
LIAVAVYVAFAAITLPLLPSFLLLPLIAFS